MNPKKKSAAPALPAAFERVWEARLYSGTGHEFELIGWLVTLSGDPNRPAGIVYSEGNETSDDRDGFETAMAVADAPWLMGQMKFRGVNFQGAQLPAWLWALRVVPMENANGDADEQRNQPLVPTRERARGR